VSESTYLHLYAAGKRQSGLRGEQAIAERRELSQSSRVLVAIYLNEKNYNLFTDKPPRSDASKSSLDIVDVYDFVSGASCSFRTYSLPVTIGQHFTLIKRAVRNLIYGRVLIQRLIVR